jgi:hypothetical protein
MMNMLGSFAQFERKMIKENVFARRIRLRKKFKDKAAKRILPRSALVRITKLRRLQTEIVLAKERNQLVEKELVGAQAAYLLASMRAKFLVLPTSYARACAHKPVDEIVQILREAVTKALEELAGFPERIVDPNWLRSLDKEQE